MTCQEGRKEELRQTPHKTKIISFVLRPAASFCALGGHADITSAQACTKASDPMNLMIGGEGVKSRVDVTYVEGSLGASCAHGGRKAVILSRCGGFHALLVGLPGLSNRILLRL